MALGGVYTTGTVTIAVDRVTVTGVGTLWSMQISAGDWLLIAGQVGLVQSVSGDTTLLLQSQWQGTLPSAATYVIVKMSWLRYDPALTQAKLRELLAALAEQGTFIFTDVAPPDPALGQDGQWALKTDVSPWRLWFKTGGVWVEQATPAGMNWRGVWSAAVAYAPGDGVSRSGASYISKTSNTNKPPESNASDWDLMAAQGSPGTPGVAGPPGMVWRGNWVTGGVGGAGYAINDAVAASNGTSYIATAAHPPGEATPPGTGWNTLAQGGTTSIADRQIDPIKLNSDLQSEKDAFADELTVVKRGGDTMTGDLTIAKATPALTLRKTAAAQNAGLWGNNAGANRWFAALADATAEPGGQVGSDFALFYYNDDGSFRGTALRGKRADGLLTVNGDPTNALGIVSKQYADKAVRTDAVQAFTAAQQLQARQNIFAAPIDALGFGGMQMNGAMEIAQLVGTNALTHSSATGSGYCAVDGWFTYQGGGTYAFTSQQVASSFAPFNKSLRLTCTIAQAAPPDYVQLAHAIEGYRFKRAGWGTAAAVPVSICFWAKSSIAASSLLVRLASQTYSADNTINLVANTPTFIKLTYTPPASWDGNPTTGLGASLSFFLANPGGGGYNFVSTVGSTFEISGLFIVPGNELPPVERLPMVMRPFDTELALCQRYYEKSYDLGTAIGAGSTPPGYWLLYKYGTASALGGAIETVPFAVRKRAAPTFQIYSAGTGAAGNISVNGTTDSTSINLGVNEERWQIWNASALAAAGDWGAYHWAADARIH